MDDGGEAPGAERIRTWAAWVLLSLPLAALPLFWVRVFRSRLVAWDRVTLVTLPVMALAAAAVLLLTGFAELRRKFRESRLNLLLAFLAAALLVQSLVRSFAATGRPPFAEWFLPLLPLAGMALSREIMRILPRWGTIVLGILIVFTLRFPFFIGLPGNWNWNLSLLAVLIPAPILLWRNTPRQFWIHVLAVAAFLLAFSLFRPQLAPRGVIVGVVTASATLWLLWNLPRRQRVFIAMLGGGVGIAMFISICQGPADPAIRSSRFWLWRGSMELALEKGMFGVGAGNFERHITRHLPKEYYFSEFATNLHTHPHNELLAAWCDAGVLGVGFVLVFVLAAVCGLRSRSSTRVWSFWLFVVLFVHGQFDVVLQTPLAGTLWLVVGGALAGGDAPARRDERPHLVWGAAGAVATVVLAAVTFRASWLSREALLDHAAGELFIAGKKLEKSLALLETPEARYRIGQIELQLNSPDAAIRHFEKLAPGYLHSNRCLGHAYALLPTPDHQKSLYYFDLESRNYPLSALNAYLQLGEMRASGYDEVSLAPYESRLKYLLRLRGVSLRELLNDPALDDLPLRNP